ncbi:hypothetical protein Q9189_002838 [Teloschistes chrysophthalmus]
METTRGSLAATISIALFTIFAIAGLLKTYQARMPLYRYRKMGLPMPPWNPILGHLCFCYKIASALPKDAHPNYLPDMIRRQMPELGSIFYLDTWPFGPQMLVVASAAGLYQITQQHPLPKYHALKHFLKPISEGLDIVTMEGDMWKTWRGIFNPGFSASHLMTLTEDILRDAQRFCDTLEKRCEDGQMFKMKDLTDNLTMDIIGKVVL